MSKIIRFVLTAALIYLATFGHQTWAMALLLILIAMANELAVAQSKRRTK